jgi:hypothetical protein
MTRADPEETLRQFAQLLAPYLRDALADLEAPDPPARDRDRDRARRLLSRRLHYDSTRSTDLFVRDLGRDVTANAIVFFDALRRPPHRVDSQTLAELIGAPSGRALAGMLITPLKRHADRAGFQLPPFDEDRQPGRGRVVYSDRNGIAEHIYAALERHRAAHPHWTLALPSDLLAHPETRRPAPTSLYVFSPEYADPICDAKLNETEYTTSALRTDWPGTRAAIYRSHERQGIVALLDIGTEPKEDRQWGWVVTGRLHILPKPITRAELLDEPTLAPIFARLQGRRRVPATAQLVLQRIIAGRYHDGQLPLFSTRA